MSRTGIDLLNRLFVSLRATQIFKQHIAVGWIDASVVILYQFSPFEPKLFRVKVNGILVGGLNVEGHPHKLILSKAKFQEAFEQLAAHPAASVSRKDGQRHDIQILRVCRVHSSDQTSNDLILVIGKLLEFGSNSSCSCSSIIRVAAAASNGPIKGLLVLNGQACRVELSQLQAKQTRKRQECEFQLQKKRGNTYPVHVFVSDRSKRNLQTALPA